MRFSQYSVGKNKCKESRKSLNCGGNQINAGASGNEMGESSSRRSTTNLIEENRRMLDFEASSSWSLNDICMEHDQRWPSSSDLSELFKGIEVYEQQYSLAYVKPNWEFVVCVLKWWFSFSRRVLPRATRKRKR